MKPMRVATPFSTGHVTRYPLADLAGDGLHAGALASVDPGAHRIRMTNGETLDYDALVVAVGARSRAAFSHALTFGARDRRGDPRRRRRRPRGGLQPLGRLRRAARRLVAAAALRARADDRRRGGRDGHARRARSPSSRRRTRRWRSSGPAASDAVAGLLREAGIAFRGVVYADVARRRAHRAAPRRRRAARRARREHPRARRPGHRGPPRDGRGLPRRSTTTRACAAARTSTPPATAPTSPVKQGGIGCQQADVAAAHIAARAGAPVEPAPFRAGAARQADDRPRRGVPAPPPAGRRGRG